MLSDKDIDPNALADRLSNISPLPPDTGSRRDSFNSDSSDRWWESDSESVLGKYRDSKPLSLHSQSDDETSLYKHVFSRGATPDLMTQDQSKPLIPADARPDEGKTLPSEIDAIKPHSSENAAVSGEHGKTLEKEPESPSLQTPPPQYFSRERTFGDGESIKINPRLNTIDWEPTITPKSRIDAFYNKVFDVLDHKPKHAGLMILGAALVVSLIAAGSAGEFNKYEETPTK